jgi:hypothetical protein
MGNVTVMCAPIYVIDGREIEAGGCGYRWQADWAKLLKAGIACVNCSRKVIKKALAEAIGTRTEAQLAPRFVILDDPKGTTLRQRRKTVFRLDFEIAPEPIPKPPPKPAPPATPATVTPPADDNE